MESSLLIKNKNAQAWGTDLVIALMIFSFGVLVFYVYSSTYSDDAETTLNALIQQGNTISDTILTPGYPLNWDRNNVVTIGILDNNKINETKLQEFYYLTQTDYVRTKSMFNAQYDYYFTLDSSIIIDSTEVAGIGKPGINITELNPKNLIKITRFTIYQNKPTTAYLYIFEE